MAHRQPRHHKPENPLDDLIFLVLSRMTQKVKYVRLSSIITTGKPPGRNKDAESMASKKSPPEQ